MRTLIIVPIVHTPEDLGPHLKEIRKRYIARYGPGRWRQRLRLVEELWEGIRERILALQLDFSKVRLYQDGLPECGREREIVEELAREGSRNHQLLLELLQKGAILMGTESPPLLLRERERFLNQGIPQNRSVDEQNGLYDELIHQRDQHIGERISSTLLDGETGVLFIGALHRAAQEVPSDIAICAL